MNFHKYDTKKKEKKLRGIIKMQRFFMNQLKFCFFKILKNHLGAVCKIYVLDFKDRNEFLKI